MNVLLKLLVNNINNSLVAPNLVAVAPSLAVRKQSTSVMPASAPADNHNNNNKDATVTPPPGLPKTVYLIRHAESEENRRIGSVKNVFTSLRSFSFPSRLDVGASLELVNVAAQIDSPVSYLGKAQIATMAQQLKQADFVKLSDIQLVLHSPLERARQTCLGLLGCVAPLKATTDQHHDEAIPDLPRVAQVDLLAEKTPSEWVPGNAGALTARVQAFQDYLRAQPETSVAVVGHSQYFKHMLGLDFKFANCDVWKVEFAADDRGPPATVLVDGTTYTLPPPWSNLQRLYVSDPIPPPAKEHAMG